ncbi:hypothetical protein BDZ85DRAFT_286260 [Elsinoe ampelina]|uniref:Uncharacterized protein n=1 Tax=Elsinoe ampelina TaxID=302913 RepID=A0A6A6FZ87_9PEZI|nr:hypothetical protein BDZ85DRAFT_286260 [Elsinoe ampelina]
MRFAAASLTFALAAIASAAPVEAGSSMDLAIAAGQEAGTGSLLHSEATPALVPALHKRTFTKSLSSDTGTFYRATINGISVLIYMYFDLAVNRAIFYWEPNGRGPPPPPSFRIGFRDYTKHLFQAAVALGPGQHQVIYKAGPGDSINVFKQDRADAAEEDILG